MATQNGWQSTTSSKAFGSIRDRVAALRMAMLTIGMQLVIRTMLFLRAWNY